MIASLELGTGCSTGSYGHDALGSLCIGNSCMESTKQLHAERVAANCLWRTCVQSGYESECRLARQSTHLALMLPEACCSFWAHAVKRLLVSKSLSIHGRLQTMICRISDGVSQVPNQLQPLRQNQQASFQHCTIATQLDTGHRHACQPLIPEGDKQKERAPPPPPTLGSAAQAPTHHHKRRQGEPPFEAAFLPVCSTAFQNPTAAEQASCWPASR